MVTPITLRPRQQISVARAFALTSLSILSALLAAGCSKPPEPPKPEPPKVTVAHPEERKLVDYDQYNGWTDAAATVEVRSRVRGHIHAVNFTDGQMVNADDLLFELDPRPFQSEVDRASEQLKIAEAQLETATKDEERQVKLMERQATTQTELEKSTAVRKTWEAQVAAAEEEIRRKQLELSYSKITAPIAGKVSRALLTPGNLVNAGGSDPVLTTIVEIDPIFVFFSVDESSLLRYRNRKLAVDGELKPIEEATIPFEFGLETDAGYPNQGMLNFANNRIDPTTGTIEVRGQAENKQRVFLPGGRVRVRVPVTEEYQALVIPDTAILSDLDKKYVLCLNAERNVIRRDIRPGRLLDDGMRVVLPGSSSENALTAADWVIVMGLQRARLNYPVTPVDANGEPIPPAAN